jgi:hypothetical protein
MVAAPDAAWFACPDCSSAWHAGVYRDACEICQRFRWRRPCPVCGGTCGRWWSVAVLDTLDSGKEHLHGRCGKPMHSAQLRAAEPVAWC